MNRISKKVLILPLLLLLLFLASSCGNQPSGEKVTNFVSSEDTVQLGKESERGDNTKLDDPVIVRRAVQATETPATEAPTTETPAEEPSTKEPATLSPPATEDPVPQSTVTISIIGDEKKGVILEPTSIDWRDGDSVLDVLKQVTKSSKIPLEYRGRGMLSYVEGIANLYEFDQGASSGWLFKVNGKLATKSAGAVKLSKGDNVEWIYSIELSEEPVE
ncbi:MAG: DUF4430 domain-containing protein [Paenibacillaceae bacterium]